MQRMFLPNLPVNRVHIPAVEREALMNGGPVD